MSVESVAYQIFTCDRCKSTQKIAGSNYYGASYVFLKAKSTFPSCGGQTEHDLCGNCWDDFLSFMAKK
jgi:hypothetical protein